MCDCVLLEKLMLFFSVGSPMQKALELAKQTVLLRLLAAATATAAIVAVFVVVVVEAIVFCW